MISQSAQKTEAVRQPVPGKQHNHHCEWTKTELSGKHSLQSSAH